MLHSHFNWSAMAVSWLYYYWRPSGLFICPSTPSMCSKNLSCYTHNEVSLFCYCNVVLFFQTQLHSPLLKFLWMCLYFFCSPLVLPVSPIPRISSNMNVSSSLQHVPNHAAILLKRKNVRKVWLGGTRMESRTEAFTLWRSTVTEQSRIVDLIVLIQNSTEWNGSSLYCGIEQF